jgi:hypothetical protein
MYGFLLSFGFVLTAYGAPADDGPTVTPARPAAEDEKAQSLAARFEELNDDSRRGRRPFTTSSWPPPRRHSSLGASERSARMG